MFIAFVRAINYGLQNFWRNLGLSLTTITILILTLLSVNVLFILNILTNEAIQSVTERIDISLYFKPETSIEEADEVKKYIETFNEISAVRLLPQEEVLKNFREKHKNDAQILESIDALDENPLPITLTVKTNSPSDYKKILEEIDVAQYRDIIESKTYDDHAQIIERINFIANRVNYLAYIVSAAFSVIAFLIIFNAIRVAIYSQREEISIKKLVGATNWFIRAPFLFDGFLFALISVAITAVAVLAVLKFADPYISAILPGEFSIFLHFMREAPQIFGIQFLAVLTLIGISSAFAMRRHLRI